MAFLNKYLELNEITDVKNFFLEKGTTKEYKKNAIVDVQTIRNSIVLCISHDELNEFYKHQLGSIRGKLAESLFEDVYSRFVSLYCDSPKERYLKLLAQYPDILNLVTLREIASFIKVEPETLSRLRKKISLTKNP